MMLEYIFALKNLPMARPLDEISLSLKLSVKYRNLRTISEHKHTGRHCHKNATRYIEFLRYLC